MVAGILQYVALAVAYSLLVAATVELTLAVWQVHDPRLDIAFRLQVLVIPPLAPLLFAAIGSDRVAPGFRQQVALLDLHNWLGPQPDLTYPLWALLLAVSVATTGLETVAFLRWLRAGRSVNRRWLSGSFGRLQETTGRMARRGLRLPPVRVVAQLGPVAYTVGLLKPAILVSPALVDLLDDEELEGVLAHERIHVNRQDNGLGWLTFALRVISCYNPVIQFTYHRMGHDIERVCDDEAGKATGKPLALASALIKVYMATRVAPAGQRRGWVSGISTQAIALENRARRTLVEDRVEQLVHPGTIRPTSYPQLRLGLSAAAVIGLAYLVV